MSIKDHHGPLVLPFASCQTFQTTENLPDNPISIVEQGIQASKCGLPHTFECVEERVKEDEKKYVGAFMLGEHCVARAEDNMKKQCKQETYQQVSLTRVLLYIYQKTC